MQVINNIFKERFINKSLKFIKIKYNRFKLTRYKYQFQDYKTYLYFLDDVNYVFHYNNGISFNKRWKTQYISFYYNKNNIIKNKKEVYFNIF